MINSTISIEDRVIVFIDVHHFSMAVDGAEEIFLFLQAMYETLGDLITAHGGEIVKYLGDSILSIFPARSEPQAVDCGKEMRYAFANLVEHKGLPSEVELEVGIGAGKVAVG